MNNGSYPWYLTWPVIIIAFFIFWPGAIVLIYLRTKQTKQGAFAAASNKKVYMLIGAVLIIIGLCNIGDSFGTAFFFIVGGGVLIYYANTLAKKASRNRSYIDMIINQGETSIDKIAATLNVKYDVAVKELKTMQSIGILKGVTINEGTHSVALMQVRNTTNDLASMVNSVAEAFTGVGSVEAATPQKMVQAVCPGCGAKYTGPEGSTQVCDYCDTSFVVKG